MSDQHLIEKMRDLKASMLFVAKRLEERGNGSHAAHLRGESSDLQALINEMQDGCVAPKLMPEQSANKED